MFAPIFQDLRFKRGLKTEIVLIYDAVRVSGDGLKVMASRCIETKEFVSDIATPLPSFDFDLVVDAKESEAAASESSDESKEREKKKKDAGYWLKKVMGNML